MSSAASHAQPNTESSSAALVLLATFNGGKYLADQMQSLAMQSLKTVHLLVSDDGSTDSTRSQLERWQTCWTKGRFDILDGPRQGFAENFRSLMIRAAPEAFVAFCDQDDVWDGDKLATAVAVLQARPSGEPALYGSRSRLVDGAGKLVGMSPLFLQKPAFRNALVQSLAGGNTMVFNKYGFELAQRSARRTPFLMHDWWSYLIVSGAGGHVHYDASPHISYRQHGANAVGGGISILDRPKRLLALLGGKLSKWSDENEASLERCLDLLDEDSRHVLGRFRDLRRSSPLLVPQRLWKSGIYRQTVKGNIALGVAAVLRRL